MAVVQVTSREFRDNYPASNIYRAKQLYAKQPKMLYILNHYELHD